MIYHITISFVLSLFSTSVMSYIAMATPIGPWIDPTLVLLALILFSITLQTITTHSMALVVAAGGIGGIIATASAFSFPAIYFLDPLLFNSWVARPFYFAALLSGLALSAGWFGLWIANVLEKTLLVQEHLSFPIGQLIYKMISAGNQLHRAYELTAGLISAVLIGISQGVGKYAGLLPVHIQLIKEHTVGLITLPAIILDMSIIPMSIAIGFVTGQVIALPLLVGALMRIVVLDPLHQLQFSYLTNTEFLLAFCSGMILTGAALSLISLPRQLWLFFKRLQSGDHSARVAYAQERIQEHIVELGLWLLFSGAYFYYIGCSLLVQSYLYIGTYACVYVMALIAGKIGIAHLGRYATFVMVPAMLIFSLNYVQIICIATFVEIAGGVAVDALFGRKVGQLAIIASGKIKRYQYFGLLVSGLSIGFIFWLLVSHFQLGSSQLFAYKAKARQLLIHAQTFDYKVLLLGIGAGYMLKWVRLNPGMVLGGLLMPINISVGLIIGGMGAWMCNDRERWYPFWSGVFAGNSLWMLISAFIK